jgi:cobaltochelatase CobT
MEFLKKVRMLPSTKKPLQDKKNEKVSNNTIDKLYEDFGKDLIKANRVGRQLAQLVLSPRAPSLERMQEEGVLDPALFSGIIATPFGRAAEKPYMYFDEKFGQQLDTAITLLVDKSGSMAGEKIAMAFVAAERLAHWLNSAGINIEVLSYTYDDFRPYKSFSEPLKAGQGKYKLSGIMDGQQYGTPTAQATIWAHDRLMAAPNARKILMVLTDGEAGDNVAMVNAWIEAKSPVELVGFGIMHDVRHYVRAVKVEKPSDLMVSVAGQIKEMIDRPHLSAKRISRRRIIAEEAFKDINLEQTTFYPAAPAPSVPTP